MAKTKSERPEFGKSYQELEEIIAWFEREEVDLEEGLKKFERGLELARMCKERLKEVENKVVEIKAKFDDLGGGAEPTQSEAPF